MQPEELQGFLISKDVATVSGISKTYSRNNRIPDMNSSVLETTHLTTGYMSQRRERKVVSTDLSLALIQGEVVCLIGPNGVGKSTLLRTLSGLHPPLGGHILLNSRDITTFTPKELARNLSIVLTERVHVGALPVFTLVALGRFPYTDWAGKLRPKDVEVVTWAINAVGAVDLTNRLVHELSDGERQKVMIARALAQQPKVMILDEPTAFLDLPRRIEMLTLLRRLARDTGTAILLSTHDLDVALRTADLLWILPKDGTLQTGAPEDLVLSGALEQAFKNDGVTFDQQHGSFSMNTRRDTQITLQGDGLYALWTRKALEREGFAVRISPNGSRIQVKIHGQPEATRWHLQIQDQCSEHSTIYELLSTLRNTVKPL
ncbi:ABC transporter related [Candidatus Vecturithrix granuli]|uniref:ABC transporter related n=1 Tax=Vecturithrix granuli TaxID=1499967 RepID=A0A081C521_VECG1|nr:ABC transporter related [Candidatus Vecturithrix granuli]